MRMFLRVKIFVFQVKFGLAGVVFFKTEEIKGRFNLSYVNL